jgi:polyisoprenoid-binding protein YceI
VCDAERFPFFFLGMAADSSAMIPTSSERGGPLGSWKVLWNRWAGGEHQTEKDNKCCLIWIEEIAMKMVRLAGLAVALALSAGIAGAQVKEYKIESAHSEADFAIKHLGISTVHGAMHGVTGTLKFDGANVTKSSVEATIDVNTVNTGEPKRDEHLKTPDFFDTAKFPTMTFKSTKVTKSGEGFEVIGDLTLHGVTKSVVLKLEPPTKEMTGMDKKPHRGFTATTTINRKDFGVTGGMASAAVGDDVKIEIDIDAVQQ